MRLALLVMVAVVMINSVGCAHTQPSESRVYVVAEDSAGVGAALGRGGSGDHDCQIEHEACVETCWKKRYPWPYSREQAGWYYERCTSDCRSQYNECVRQQEEAAREKARRIGFADMERAIDWIGQHKAEVALGTIIIVGGVAFVLATSGAGALVLIPLAL